MPQADRPNSNKSRLPPTQRLARSANAQAAFDRPALRSYAWLNNFQLVQERTAWRQSGVLLHQDAARAKCLQASTIGTLWAQKNPTSPEMGFRVTSLTIWSTDYLAGGAFS